MGILKNITSGIADIARQPATFLAKAGATIGKKAADSKTGQAIKKASGLYTDDSTVKAFQKSNITTATGRDTSPFKTPKEAVGEGLLAAANLSSPALGGSSALSNIAKGALFGATSGAGDVLRKGGDNKQVKKAVLTNAALGAVSTGIFEVLGGALNSIKKTTDVNNIGATYDSTLQTSTKELADDIAHGFETVGTKIAKEGYKGTYSTMREQSKSNLKLYGGILDSKIDDILTTIERSDLESTVLKKLEDQYGVLDDLSLKTIKKVVNELPETFTARQALTSKRIIDDRIPNSLWELTDPKASFKAWTDYYTRDALRQGINNASGDTAIQAINNKLSIAMDVRKLASFQEALQRKTSFAASPGESLGIKGLLGMFTKPVAKVLKNTSVSTSTSIAQMLMNIGQVNKNLPTVANSILGSTLGVLGSATKAAAIQGLTSSNQKLPQEENKKYDLSPESIGAIPVESYNINPASINAIPVD